MRAPVRMATTRPTSRLPDNDAETTAVSAAISMMPSMAMLITPARSLTTPQSAASAIGMARPTVPFSMPTRLNDASWVAQIRKAATKQKATMAIDQPAERKPPRASCHAPRKTAIMIRV